MKLVTKEEIISLLKDLDVSETGLLDDPAIPAETAIVGDFYRFNYHLSPAYPDYHWNDSILTDIRSWYNHTSARSCSGTCSL